MGPSEVTHQIVDTLASTRMLVSDIQGASGGLWTNEPHLYFNLEGINAPGSGGVSMMVVCLEPRHRVYLVDTGKLKAAAFEVQASGASLRSILESPMITKGFFDVRKASYALYHQFGVRLKDVQDIQVMENAARPAGRRTQLAGLSRCIVNDANLSCKDKHEWERIRYEGLRLFHPSKGGTHDVFSERPMDPDLVRYCINNVQYLPQLWRIYNGKLSAAWRVRVAEQADMRIEASQSDTKKQRATDDLCPWPEEDKKEALQELVNEKLSRMALNEYFRDVLCD